MDAVPHFSRSYAEARAKFIAAARVRHLTVETHALPGWHGVDGEALAMDVALLGAVDAKGLLILTSATHGVEGYCGSGAQIGLLQDERFVRGACDAGVAVLFVHAVNPYGFSHGRRVNEDNADLNRNFRDWSVPAPANTAYAAVHPWLLPAKWPPPGENEAKIGAFIAANGERAYQAAVSGGQYEFPDGMFYGGAAASWSNVTLRAALRRHGAGRARIGWIDFHTGLGPRGHGEKIYAGRDLDADMARARHWWGADVTAYQDGTSTSAQLTGVMYNAVYDECPGIEYAGIALEYGTLPLREVFQALRADHWLHNHPDAPPELRATIRQQMRAAFYVEADDWKEQVYAQALDAARKALAQLTPRLA
jgi:hypothetical protein